MNQNLMPDQFHEGRIAAFTFGLTDGTGQTGSFELTIRIKSEEVTKKNVTIKVHAR